MIKIYLFKVILTSWNIWNISQTSNENASIVFSTVWENGTKRIRFSLLSASTGCSGEHSKSEAKLYNYYTFIFK